MLVRHVLRDRALELAQPRAYRQTQFGQPGFPDIDMNRLLDRKAETGDAMIKNADADPERWLLIKDTIGDSPAAPRLLGEGALETKLRRSGLERGCDFRYDEIRSQG